MRITTKVKKTAVSSDTEIISQDIGRQAYQWGILDIERVTTENIISFLNLLKLDLSNYLNKFEQSYNQFLLANKIKRKVIAIPKEKAQNVEVSVAKILQGIERNRYENNRKATQDFIEVFLEGHELLSLIREQLTGQSISTKMTIKTSEGTYLLDSKEVPYRVVLSTFGGTTKSPFSLAYEIDFDLLREKENLQDTLISKSDIYSAIMGIKIPYLRQKSMQTGRKYRPIFNSKDAEIYDFMLQSNLDASYLNVEKYATLRANMGGGGGYASSQLKLGDVGLVQDKYFSEKQSTVNFARYSLVKNNLQKLLNLLDASPSEIKTGLIKIFTEDEQRISNEISKQMNKEAIKYINMLFD